MYNTKLLQSSYCRLLDFVLEDVFFSNIPYVIYYERYEIHTIECTLSNQSSLLQM